MGIRYKIAKSKHIPGRGDGSVTRFIEYLQKPKRSDGWAHRGTVLEKGGKFFFRSEELSTSREVLQYRLSAP